MNRREFLQRAGMAGALLTLGRIPGVLANTGIFGDSASPEPDVVRDTINGLVAFVVPGADAYSQAQGQASLTKGGLDARATDFLIESLDGYVPQPDSPGAANDDTVPLSASVAMLLNGLSLQVNPAATAGAFLSPFARLSFSEKAEVFRRMESLDMGDADLPQPFTQASGNMRFIAGALLEFAAFGTYVEWHAFDAATRSVPSTPVGWELSGYTGPRDGWDEFIGYYQDRTEVAG